MSGKETVNNMLQIFLRMLSVTLFTSLIQNTVFSGSIGIDESIKGARKPRYLLTYGLWVTFFCLSLSLAGHFVSPLLKKILPWSASQDFLAYTVILVCIYIVSAIFCRYILGANKKYMNTIGFCAFNSLVMSMPVIGAGSLTNAIGTAVGAGIAFVISLLIIRGGMRHINANPHIPAFFRGTPALFIYISLVALALSSISGGSLFL